MSIQTGERLVLMSEVADRLAVSPRTLDRRIAAGELPKPEYNGRQRVYRESMMGELINRITTSGPSR